MRSDLRGTCRTRGRSSPSPTLSKKSCALIGGRVAEEIINGEPATGALNDLERLTRTAYNMVQYYGMSQKAAMYYDSNGSRGYDLSKPYSEKPPS